VIHTVNANQKIPVTKPNHFFFDSSDEEESDWAQYVYVPLNQNNTSKPVQEESSDDSFPNIHVPRPQNPFRVESSSEEESEASEVSEESEPSEEEESEDEKSAETERSEFLNSVNVQRYWNPVMRNMAGPALHFKNDYMNSRALACNLVTNIREYLDLWIEKRAAVQAVLEETSLHLSAKERNRRKLQLTNLYLNMTERRTTIHAFGEQIVECITALKEMFSLRSLAHPNIPSRRNVASTSSSPENLNDILNQVTNQVKSENFPSSPSNVLEIIVHALRKVNNVLKSYENSNDQFFYCPRKLVRSIRSPRYLNRIRGSLSLVDYSRIIHTNHIKSISHMTRLWYIMVSVSSIFFIEDEPL